MYVRVCECVVCVCVCVCVRVCVLRFWAHFFLSKECFLWNGVSYTDVCAFQCLTGAMGCTRGAG